MGQQSRAIAALQEALKSLTTQLAELQLQHVLRGEAFNHATTAMEFSGEEWEIW